MPKSKKNHAPSHYFYGLAVVIGAVLIGVATFALANPNRFIDRSTEKVAASIFPLYDMARNIAGDKVEVVLILPPGASPHTFEPTPSTARELADVSAVFIIGHGLDNWSIKLAENSRGADIIPVDNNIDLLESDHDDEQEGDEAEDGQDPHYWLSAKNAIVIAQNIRDSLVKLYPQYSDEFIDNYESYILELQNLDREITERLSPLGNPNFASFHSAWNYFSRDYPVRQSASFEEFPGKEPTAEYLRTFANNVRRYNVKVVFAEPQFSTAPILPMAADLGVSISVLDPIGGVAGRDSYTSLMRYNVEQMESAFK